MERRIFATEREAIDFCIDNGYRLDIRRIGVVFYVEIPVIEGTAVRVPTRDDEPVKPKAK